MLFSSFFSGDSKTIWSSGVYKDNKEGNELLYNYLKMYDFLNIKLNILINI